MAVMVVVFFAGFCEKNSMGNCLGFVFIHAAWLFGSGAVTAYKLSSMTHPAPRQGFGPHERAFLHLFSSFSLIAWLAVLPPAALTLENSKYTTPSETGVANKPTVTVSYASRDPNRT